MSELNVSFNSCGSEIPTFSEEIDMTTEQTTNWPDLAIGLYDHLTGRKAVISYEFVNMHVKVPSGTGPQAQHAEWVLSGTMKIRTGDGPLPN